MAQEIDQLAVAGNIAANAWDRLAKGAHFDIDHTRQIEVLFDTVPSCAQYA